jgi:hypothetical protein
MGLNFALQYRQERLGTVEGVLAMRVV